MPKDKKPAPKAGTVRRDRDAKGSFSVIGKIGAKLFGKKGGWEGVGGSGTKQSEKKWWK